MAGPEAEVRASPCALLCLAHSEDSSPRRSAVLRQRGTQSPTSCFEMAACRRERIPHDELLDDEAFETRGIKFGFDRHWRVKAQTESHGRKDVKGKRLFD